MTDKFSSLKLKLDKWISDFKRIQKCDWKTEISKSSTWIYKELESFGDKNMEGIMIGVTDEYGEPLSVDILKLMLRADKQEYVQYELSK